MLSRPSYPYAQGEDLSHAGWEAGPASITLSDGARTATFATATEVRAVQSAEAAANRSCVEVEVGALSGSVSIGISTEGGAAPQESPFVDTYSPPQIVVSVDGLLVTRNSSTGRAGALTRDAYATTAELNYEINLTQFAGDNVIVAVVSEDYANATLSISTAIDRHFYSSNTGSIVSTDPLYTNSFGEIYGLNDTLGVQVSGGQVTFLKNGLVQTASPAPVLTPGFNFRVLILDQNIQTSSFVAEITIPTGGGSVQQPVGSLASGILRSVLDGKRVLNYHATKKGAPFHLRDTVAITEPPPYRWLLMDTGEEETSATLENTKFYTVLGSVRPRAPAGIRPRATGVAGRR